MVVVPYWCQSVAQLYEAVRLYESVPEAVAVAVAEAVDSGVYEVDSVNYEFESVSYTVYYIEAASVDPVVYAVGPAYPPHEGERATTYGKLLPRVSLAPGLV